MTLAVAALSALSVWIFRRALDEELNASLLAVASIQAASVTDSPGGGMEFHEWELTPDEATSVRDLVRYAQVWSAEGRSLLRSQYMTSDLPVDPVALDEAAAGDLVWGHGLYDAIPVRVLYYPLSRFGRSHEGHVLEVAAPLTARDALVQRLVLSSVLVTGLVALAALLGSRWLAGRVVRPVHEVIDQAEGLGARSLDTRISAYADTVEYRRLVDVLNTMLDRLQSAFEAQRRFTADASHELRSPLTVLRGELELALRRERSREEYREVLSSGVEEVRRLSEITQNLLTLARSDAGALTPDPQRIDAVEVVTHIVDRLRPVAEARHVTILVRGDGLHLEIDRGLLSQVTWNLVENAIRFSPPGGTVEVEVGAAHAQGRTALRLDVLDRGPGPGPDPDALFRRFFREDPARTRGNAGLGLAIVRAIAEAHGGEVGAEPRAGGGAVVWARLSEMKAP
jgi:two-component system OmpR family sensor kinase